MRGGLGGVAGQNFEKNAFENFQFRKILVPDVLNLILRDFSLKSWMPLTPHPHTGPLL